MALYRIKPGCVHGAFNQHREGDVVEYTPEEAAGFMDKLELVEAEEGEPEAKPLPELTTTVKPKLTTVSQPAAKRPKNQTKS